MSEPTDNRMTNEPGEIFVLGTQPVKGPRTHRGPLELRHARVHLQERLGVRRYVRVHATK